MSALEFCAALLRATLATSLAACLAGSLLTVVRLSSPRIHRLVWALALLPGWILWPYTWQIETSPPSQPAIERVLAAPATLWTSDAAPQHAQPSAAPVAPTASPVSAPMQIVPVVWVAGAALLVARKTLHYRRVVYSLPLGELPAEPSWSHQWQRELQAARVRSRVEFRTTDRLGPLVCYVPFFYVVLAPRALWHVLADQERAAILRHELAHLVRGDLWKSLVIRLLALPQWFNPLAWLAVRRFDEAGEWAADEAAARAADGSQFALANSLLRAAEFISAVPPGAAAIQGGILSRRIQRLVAPRLKEDSIMKKLLILSILVVIVASQLIRIEHVAAKPAAVDINEWESGAQLNMPIGVRRNMAAVRHQQLLLARERVVSQEQPAADAQSANTDPAKRREYKEAAWPRYIIEPPDILSIEGIRLAPKMPYRIEPFDALLIRATGALPDHPVDDAYVVDAQGSVNLGPTYGRIPIAGLTIEQAEARVREKMAKASADVKVALSLTAPAGVQQLTGQHLVAMDGRVNLGIYGAVYVAGLTLEQARDAIQRQLSHKLDRPQVAVDVLAYNSKVYYVISKGTSDGDNVVRMPVTGNETVLDAVAAVGGVSQAAAAKMWVARPPADGKGSEQVLPVAWNDIADGSSAATNYQLQPGDRLFIETQPPVENSQAPSTLASRVGDLRVHDVITVLVDYPAAAKHRRPSSFRIACEVKDVRPNGTLRIEGKQIIRNNNEPWQISLSGEVRREAILPDCTVSSRSIANLNIEKSVVSAEAAPQTVTIVLRQNGGEMLMKQAYVTGETIGDALDGAVYPNPVNLAEAVISLERTKGKRATVQMIGWDASRNRPNEGDDRVLEPGDRLVVDLSQPGPYESRIAPSSPHQPQPAPAGRYEAVGSYSAVVPPTPVDAEPSVKPWKVEFDIAFIEDEKGTMTEYDDLRTAAMMRGDRESTLGALRALKKFGLITLTKLPGTPKVVADVGATTTIEYADQPAMEISTRVLNASALVVDIRLLQDKLGRGISFVLDGKQQESFIIKLHDEATSDKKHSAYVVVLPRWIK